MELLAVNSEGVAGIIRNNQSTVQEAGFSTPFTIDNRIATVYYIESGKVLRMSLRNPQDIWVSKLDLQKILHKKHVYFYQLLGTDDYKNSVCVIKVYVLS